jgi:hypothetical protein
VLGTHLVDGHCAYWHRAVAHDPLARLVDVGASGQVHDGVCSPDGAPLQLLNLLQRALCAVMRVEKLLQKGLVEKAKEWKMIHL